MIRFENVDVNFGGHQAVQGLDLEIKEGEFFTLLGPSGCGKTTALRSLAGFVAPSSGRILIDGKNVTRVPSESRGVGMVFQNYALFPSMNVRENIAFGLSVKKFSKMEQIKRVDEIAERTGLNGQQLEKNVSELSGGQQQRVAIARALVLTPRILLLDEPLSNLDAKLRVQMREQLQTMQRDFGVTCVYVTHDQEEALTLSHRIAVLNEGQLQQVGTPEEIYNGSATSFVCRFIGESNRLTPRVLEIINREAGAALDTEAESYLRPEKLRVSAPPAGMGVGQATIPVTVLSRSYHGTHSIYTVAAEDTELRVSISELGEERHNTGDTFALTIDPRWVLQYQER